MSHLESVACCPGAGEGVCGRRGDEGETVEILASALASQVPQDRHREQHSETLIFPICRDSKHTAGFELYAHGPTLLMVETNSRREIGFSK
jgi:hypothetical protein